MAGLPITFLSDYGYEDEFAGVCRAVIARIAPDSTVIDLTHAIPPHDIGAGAGALARALPHAPCGVHLAVVDPGVGSDRRAVAVATAEVGHLLVGPDNGLLVPALDALGGAGEAVEISASRYCAARVSATFHGRDIFAPLAAHLATGVALAEAGTAIDPESLIGVPVPAPELRDDHILAHVTEVDRFGNASLDLRLDQLDGHPLGSADELLIEGPGHTERAVSGRQFADAAPGGLILYEDSSGALALAINRGDAASALGLARGDEVILRIA